MSDTIGLNLVIKWMPPEQKTRGCEFSSIFNMCSLPMTLYPPPPPTPHPCLPVSSSTVTPDLCLSFFLRRRSVPHQPHPPHCAASLPAAAHRRAARLVLPQVKARAHPHPSTPHTHPPPEPGSGRGFGWVGGNSG